MDNKVKDLTIDQLKTLIKETIQETISDEIETWMASTSNAYLESIKEARSDYKQNKVVSLEEGFKNEDSAH
jgi:hypothetical protein